MNSKPRYLVLLYLCLVTDPGTRLALKLYLYLTRVRSAAALNLMNLMNSLLFLKTGNTEQIKGKLTAVDKSSSNDNLNRDPNAESDIHPRKGHTPLIPDQIE
jgi:hypothetical protein